MSNPYNVKYLNDTSYIREREVEIGIESSLNWAHELSVGEQIRINGLVNGRGDLEEIVEYLSYISYEDLILREGLDDDKNRCFVETIVRMANEIQIPVHKLFQWITLVGESYLNMKKLVSKPSNKLDESERNILKNSRLTRQIIETWPCYIYLGTLILRNELTVEG